VTDPAALVISPNHWPLARQLWTGAVEASAAREFRRELGIPGGDVAPVILSGHQAGIWHAGILAKVFAGVSLARRLNGHFAWIDVDQDANESCETVRIPVRDSVTGEIAEHRWRTQTEGEALSDVVCGRRPAITVSDEPPPLDFCREDLLPQVASGIDAMTGALKASAGSPSVSSQFTHAALSLARQTIGAEPITAISALRIARTSLFARIVDRMAADPLACARAYNAAATTLRVPGIGVLTINESSGEPHCELPLWRISAATGTRSGVWSHSLAQTPREELAPKALLLTGMLRAAGCETFIHGSGGGATGVADGGYDKVTEAWLRDWLGWRLAPSVVVRATLRLPLLNREPITESEVAQLVAHSHRARHSPALLGDRAAEMERSRLVAILTDRAWGKTARRASFDQLHTLLDRVRSERSHEISQLDRSVSSLKARFKHERLAADRTWPFVFHETERLKQLAREIESRVNA